MKQPRMKILHPSFDPRENWRTGNQKGDLCSKAWKDLRQQILERDNFTCAYCGHRADKYLTVDHIDGVPENNDGKNLQVLCMWCHMIKHSGMFCVIEEVVDLYLPPPGLTQIKVIRQTRILRGRGLSDDEILNKLRLKKKKPFKMDHKYLKKLVGFITTRPGQCDGKIYGNINIKGPDGRFLPVQPERPQHGHALDYEKPGMVRVPASQDGTFGYWKDIGAPGERKPSEVTEIYWISTERKKGRYPEAQKSGKWLIFVDVKHIDEVWAKIKKATEEGILGNGAKVATAKPNPNATNPNTKVICIYTYDWTDENDVRRVRQELRGLGITWKIPYKTDEDTLKGKYSIKGNTRISKYFE